MVLCSEINAPVQERLFAKVPVKFAQLQIVCVEDGPSSVTSLPEV